MNRRAFLGKTVSGLGLMSLGPRAWASERPGHLSELPVLVFSKHLQHLNFKQLAEKARGIGFDGVDLTVRPGGHVEPLKVREQLPEAVAALRAEGLGPVTMSTDVLRNKAGHDRAVLETAKELEISQYRVGSARYQMGEEKVIEDQLADWTDSIRQLALLNGEIGIQGAVQNHSRYFLGGLIWDLWMALKDLNPTVMACHYDICHAVAEATISWPVGFKLLRPRISAIVVKDFVFDRRGDANTRRFVPLGTGMVPWKQFWGLVRESGLDVPIILHMEYGRSPEEEERYLERDLESLRAMLKES